MYVIYPFLSFFLARRGQDVYYSFPFPFLDHRHNYLVTVSVILAPLLGVELDKSVDSHDGHAGLDGTFELLHLAHAGLQHAGLQTVVHAALCQVKTVVAVALGFGDGFSVGVGG